jgi:hypothetical protein
VRYRQLDRLDKLSTFIRYPANWQGEARLLCGSLILAKSQDPRPRTNDAGCSRNSFYDFSPFHTRQETPFPSSVLFATRHGQVPLFFDSFGVALPVIFAVDCYLL